MSTTCKCFFLQNPLKTAHLFGLYLKNLVYRNDIKELYTLLLKEKKLEVHSVRLAAVSPTFPSQGALVLRSLRLINHLPRYCFTLLRCSCMRHAFQFGVDQGSNAMKWKMPEALYLRTSSQVVFKDDIPAMHHNRISFTGFGGGNEWWQKIPGWNRANLG